MVFLVREGFDLGDRKNKKAKKRGVWGLVLGFIGVWWWLFGGCGWFGGEKIQSLYLDP